MHKLFKMLAFAGFMLAAGLQVQAQTPTHYYVAIKTGQGEALLKLYNETPKHRDNFVRLVRQGYYDSLLFHRVIRHFMIQGGDPDSRSAAPKQVLGEGDTDYRIPAEFLPERIHKKGAIGAARDNNPQKESSGSQFYLVQGRVFSDAGLDSLENFRLKRKLTPQQRETYRTIGGTPHLDGEYTVFGELINGFEVVDSIAAVPTDAQDRPLTDQRMYMRTLTRNEALELELGKVPRRSLLKRIFSRRPDPDYILP